VLADTKKCMQITDIDEFLRVENKYCRTITTIYIGLWQTTGGKESPRLRHGSFVMLISSTAEATLLGLMLASGS
jgi:hypothetical protein